MLTSDNTQIPEMVNLHDMFKTDASDQAELFNCYFQQQFSEPSSCDIQIFSSVSNDRCSNFSPDRVFSIDLTQKYKA